MNKKSPYRIVQSDKGDFLFFTDAGILYDISFVEEFPIGNCMSYQFGIQNANEHHGAYDPKIKQTIVVIIEEFFSTYENVLLYICDTSDRREGARNRLFLRWFENEKAPEKYTIRNAHVKIEGETLYIAIIVSNLNPKLDEIIKEFDLNVKHFSELPK